MPNFNTVASPLMTDWVQNCAASSFGSPATSSCARPVLCRWQTLPHSSRGALLIRAAFCLTYFLFYVLTKYDTKCYNRHLPKLPASAIRSYFKFRTIFTITETLEYHTFTEISWNNLNVEKLCNFYATKMYIFCLYFVREMWLFQWQKDIKTWP